MQYKHELPFKYSFTTFSSKQKESGQIPIVKMSKKGDFENPKVPNRDFSTKSVSDQCGFSNSAVCWGPKNRTNWGIPVVHTRPDKNGRKRITVYSHHCAFKRDTF